MMLFARHAATERNLAHAMQGSGADPNLAEIGRRQAEHLARYVMANFTPAAIYVSPSRRARQTATPLAEATGLSVIEDACLLERQLGPYEGMPRASVSTERTAKGLSLADETQDWLGELRVEQDAELVSRFFGLCRSRPSVLSDSQGDDILLITHAGMMKAIAYNVLGIPPAQPRAFKITEASLMAFNFQPPWSFELRQLWPNPVSKRSSEEK